MCTIESASVRIEYLGILKQKSVICKDSPGQLLTLPSYLWSHSHFYCTLWNLKIIDNLWPEIVGIQSTTCIHWSYLAPWDAFSLSDWEWNHLNHLRWQTFDLWKYRKLKKWLLAIKTEWHLLRKHWAQSRLIMDRKRSIRVFRPTSLRILNWAKKEETCYGLHFFSKEEVVALKEWFHRWYF